MKRTGNRKLIFILITSFIFLTGCQGIYNNYQNHLKGIDTLVHQEKWIEASSELKQMKKTYEKKYQWRDFYIRPVDYASLIELLGQLKGAIAEKDGKQAKILIDAIGMFTEEIYYQQNQQ